MTTYLKKKFEIYFSKTKKKPQKEEKPSRHLVETEHQSNSKRFLKVCISCHSEIFWRKFVKILFLFPIDGSNKALPALLSRAEMYTQELADEARLRRGKEMEQNDLGCECAVSNPPPSPVTEYNEPFTYSSDFEPRETICQRNIQEYGDEFLDLGGEVDMEVF